MEMAALPLEVGVRRVAVLWSHLSGYLNACLRECRRRDVELLVSWFRADRQAPFADAQFGWLRSEGRGLEWDGSEHIDCRQLVEALEGFDPQVILVSGWNHPAYRSAARRFRGKAVRLLCMDNQWSEHPKQWLGRAIAPWYVRPLYEGAFVSGERQFQFARRLGFSAGEIVTGLYAPDSLRFRKVHSASDVRPAGFLYVGRLSPEKGIATLVEAYRRYRALSPAPWPIAIAGSGPLQSLVSGLEGVQVLGFVQPEDLPAVMSRHACLVVPSEKEPWGVQISEGVTAGLPIVATSVCGASVHLVREGFNGYVVAPGDPTGLARAMLRIERNPRLDRFADNSRTLAAQFTPELWADNLLSHPSIDRFYGVRLD